MSFPSMIEFDLGIIGWCQLRHRIVVTVVRVVLLESSSKYCSIEIHCRMELVLPECLICNILPFIPAAWEQSVAAARSKIHVAIISISSLPVLSPRSRRRLASPIAAPAPVWFLRCLQMTWVTSNEFGP
jgi:hypothetical protein